MKDTFTKKCIVCSNDLEPGSCSKCEPRERDAVLFLMQLYHQRIEKSNKVIAETDSEQVRDFALDSIERNNKKLRVLVTLARIL